MSKTAFPAVRSFIIWGWITVRLINGCPKSASGNANQLCGPALDPFKDRIKGLLERYPYTATQIFQRICEEGFTGGYGIVKDYVRKVRPRKSQAFLKLSFAPGECAQVDWGSYGSINAGSTKRRLSIFFPPTKMPLTTLVVCLIKSW